MVKTEITSQERLFRPWFSGDSDGKTKIRLIIYFAAKDGKALYSQQKQDQELTVAQIINSLLPNLVLN